MRDIRLYGYDFGNLIKLNGNKFHKFTSVEAAINTISIKRNYGMYQKECREQQYVIIDYTDNPGGVIVEVIDPLTDEHAKVTQMGQDT